ncbi:hypothetical protein H1D32_16960 [Anaerobacillus sp. CMMVII]|uniref:hypothetical protein n=1 Tax=Anaerobacillus sp. CMMVII TaxID=2755588 RepID=UPI0021B79885|nr:hypothetical protein [Anaerobacillus sp. CMMVII]MCT8139244.1 hypothetical protein [Anaerobacillus sp. CMMVII]
MKNINRSTIIFSIFGFAFIAFVLLTIDKDPKGQTIKEDTSVSVSINETANQEPATPVVASKELDYKGEISSAHHKLNSLLGYGRDQKVDFESSTYHTFYLDTFNLLEQARSSTSSSMEKVNIDLENALTILQIANLKKDLNGLLYTHRIIHDLDRSLNGSKIDWGYSYHAEGKETSAYKRHVISYINKNIELVNKDIEDEKNPS